MARGKADIANTALRIFLQEMGAAYDEERGLTPYSGNRDFKTVRDFFGERCCYCDVDLGASRPAQDHLIPMNKTSLGLHAWGNVVPACQDCNARKHGREWHAYLVDRAGTSAAERYKRVSDFVATLLQRTRLCCDAIATTTNLHGPDGRCGTGSSGTSACRFWTFPEAHPERGGRVELVVGGTVR